MAKLTRQQKAMKLLEQLRQRELSNNSTPKFVKPGVNGESLTGKKKWG